MVILWGLVCLMVGVSIGGLLMEVVQHLRGCKECRHLRALLELQNATRPRRPHLGVGEMPPHLGTRKANPPRTVTKGRSASTVNSEYGRHMV